MAGIVRGKVDCFSNQANPWANCQEMFKGAMDFCSNNPRMTRLAWYRGDSGGNVPGNTSRGSDYWDGAAPYGRNAWGLFQMSYAQYPYAFLLQFQDGSNETVNGGGTLNGATTNSTVPAIGIQMVACKTSEGVPATGWNGTLNNNGLDTKSGAWWTAPVGGRCYAFPRSNSTGGASATNKNNLANLVNNGNAGAWRYHFLSDDDNFCFLGATGGGTTYTAIAAGGIYLPRTDLISLIDMPLLMVASASATLDGFQLLASQIYGPTTAAANYAGGIRVTDEALGASSSNDVVWFGFEELTTSPRGANYNPNKLFNPAKYDGNPLYVTASEAPAAYGNAGSWDFLRHTFAVATNDWNAGGTRAIFGGTTTTTSKLSVPWGGGFAPATNATRAGRSF